MKPSRQVYLLKLFLYFAALHFSFKELASMTTSMPSMDMLYAILLDIADGKAERVSHAIPLHEDGKATGVAPLLAAGSLGGIAMDILHQRFGAPLAPELLALPTSSVPPDLLLEIAGGDPGLVSKAQASVKDSTHASLQTREAAGVIVLSILAQRFAAQVPAWLWTFNSSLSTEIRNPLRNLSLGLPAEEDVPAR
ncbi:MAG: hypothetical protein ACRYHA_01275 [Janthinobacterium lividum]